MGAAARARSQVFAQITKALFRGDLDEISGNGDEEIFVASAVGTGVTNSRTTRSRTPRQRWQEGRRTGGFTCTRRPHSFDQVVVECVKRPWCRPEKRVAFVYRQPAAAQRLGATAAPPAEPPELEPLGEDDALPRTEED